MVTPYIGIHLFLNDILHASKEHRYTMHYIHQCTVQQH